MTYTTDERLKSYLDTNQLHREQMCLAILTLDKRFSDVRPRHPRGGPDGGRDIEALFRKEHHAYGAVGFANQAADTDEKKRDIRAKFAADLTRALETTPPPKVFVFLTNVNLTIGEKNQLIGSAKRLGLTECDIFDRERLRISLDSADGFAVRFQYLGIPMSDAEQASFFAKWGDEINSVIATGFQEIQGTLDHVLFLQESYAPISGFYVRLQLDQEYSGEEIGHFRAFCSLYLKEPKLNILSLLFGASDKSNRFRRDLGEDGYVQLGGIANGIGAGQWIQHFEPEQSRDAQMQPADDGHPERYKQVGSSSSAGADPVQSIFIGYQTSGFVGVQPTLCLRDFDECMFLFIVNRSIAHRIQQIHVMCNGYKLMEALPGAFHVDESSYEAGIPGSFETSELADPWVHIRPTVASAFHLSFSEEVPVRMFAPRPASANLPARHRRS